MASIVASVRPGRLYPRGNSSGENYAARRHLRARLVDVADAHVKALEHLLNAGESGALSLANARGASRRKASPRPRGCAAALYRQ